ncbi:protein of unknown function [Aliiroseovarius halocynthiae]|uniref:DUF4173 domain-containing protein n=1 Tax=Aliiroseovarius halocynthiae TaxID=985055 RepID=A0A545SU50_9RHOB|nr:DUF4173 domain-containing protein [Aliiroseovarius halocynthiae]TQV68499.1 DUF4173 domain-containing protein [Aliiroseovarius halocynthiae]SMR70897.1 protein of unknown function [Aliiroseovarius halocynthiae]
MPKQLIIRGVPDAIARDGWWLASDATLPQHEPPSPTFPILGEAMKRRMPWIASVVFLVALGDLLFWGYVPGVSLVIFAWAIFAVACASRPPKRRVIAPALLLVLASLPMVEHAQLLSFGFLTAGLLVSVAWLRIAPSRGVEVLGAAALRLSASLPVAGVKGVLNCARAVSHERANGALPAWFSAGYLMRNWAFPIGGSLVLTVLLVNANPVFERAIVQAFQIDIDLFSLMRRVLLWVGLGLLVWPFLIVQAPKAAMVVTPPKTGIKLGLNAGSVLRALVMFNLFLAVQSAMDVSILFGGASLPDGMSHASYAHRGAYPLLITAMLAGAFALAARPFLAEHRALKPLVLLWLAQNVLLTGSAAMRLELYIDVYGLTYLRIYALIWMGLVALGLIMVAWQVLRECSARWLLIRSAIWGAGALYVCAFINFAGLIAADILTRATDPTVETQTDWHYLCSLGPAASKSIAQGTWPKLQIATPFWATNCLNPQPVAMNWREWDFRTGRINGYLAVDAKMRAVRDEDPVGR